MTVTKCFFLAPLLLSIVFLSADTALGEDSALITPDLNPSKTPAIQSGKQILLKMTQAMRTLNYQGTIAFLRNGKLEPMKYFHAANNGVEQERLLSLNSPLREIIRDADKVSCLYKAAQQIVVDYRPFERSFLIELPKNLGELDTIYNIDIVGEENIAMQLAYVIAITPKDNLRYARKIWLNKQYFLPLKLAVYNFYEGVFLDKALEQLVFTDMQVIDALPFVEINKPDPNNLGQASYKPQQQSSNQAGFTVSKPPHGFKEIFFTRRPLHKAQQPVDHLLLSDGLASVSIYMEHKNNALQSEATLSKNVQSVGAVNFFSRTLGDFELTVMGEVPALTVKLIAEGVKLKNAGD
ncbi:MAG: MucB/RseB C-terminal domain-containing protein [Methylovulum sp.]|nr:MucB/RseB C-terminal domain-containing protein [Methylovulum sp.]